MEQQIQNRTVALKSRAPTLLVAALLCWSALHAVGAQTNGFNLLYTFGTTSSSGVGPFGGLIMSSNTLYGTTFVGGSARSGTVFSLNTDGSGMTNLYSFPGGIGGGNPIFGVTISGHTLFGTTPGGGTGDDGTVFMLNTDGSDFTNVYEFTPRIDSFTNCDGADAGGLTLAGNTLYGVALGGGSEGVGTVFRVNTDGSDFTNLHNFPLFYTNGSGNPQTGHLLLSGNTLFGTIPWSQYGFVFSLNTDGSNFTNLYTFTNGSDGSGPGPNLILSGNTLYGTAYDGGTNGNGTVFALNTNGSGFTVLHGFAATIGEGNTYYLVNSDGAKPIALVLSGNLLYGTTEQGGSLGYGTVFSMNTDGMGFTNLYLFSGGSDGSEPDALLLSGNTLYGTAAVAGSGEAGTIFALTLPLPTLGIVPAGNQIVLSWPASAPNFVLQTAPDLSSGSWSNLSSGIFTNGNTCLLTNPVSSQAAFFRLQQQ